MGSPSPPPLETTEAFNVSCCSSATLSAAAVETKGKRNSLEDAHSMACEGRSGNFWLLDGHRGAEAALFAAKALPKEIGDTIKKARLPSTARIQQGFRAVDNCLRKHFKKQKEVKAGSTVVGALVAHQEDGSYTAKLINCGDSRGVVIKDPDEETMDDEFVLETVDHKPDSPTERRRIKAAGGKVRGGKCPRVDGRLAVSRSLGDFEFKADRGLKASEQKVSCEPDIYEVDGLQAGSLLLLACDGVWDVLSTDRVASMVREYLKVKPGNLGEVASMIVRQSLEMGSTDNISVLLVRLAGATPKLTELGGSQEEGGLVSSCATG